MRTIHAKHEPYTNGHLGEVIEDMKLRGAPTIRVMNFNGELYATEGSHRLAAASILGLIPKVVIEIPDSGAIPEEHWTKVSFTLPRHEYDHVLSLDLESFREVK